MDFNGTICLVNIQKIIAFVYFHFDVNLKSILLNFEIDTFFN